MKFLVTAALILTLNGFVNAQQAKLLGEDGQGTAAQTSTENVTAAPASAGKNPSPAKAAVVITSTASADGAASAKSSVPAKAAGGSTTVKPAEAKKGGFLVDRKHSVAGGDTLWALSRKYYGDSFKWGKIYNANTGTVKNPDRIYPADELVIPDITEEIKPAPAPYAITGMVRGVEVSPAAAPATGDAKPDETGAPAAAGPAPAVESEQLQTLDLADLSEEMPQDMKEWRNDVKIVPDNWTEAGVITAKESAGSGDYSLAVSGEIVLIRVANPSAFKPGDTLTSYMKGASAFDRKGKRLGREILKTGMLEVISVGGDTVKARILDASTYINRGQVIKK